MRKTLLITLSFFFTLSAFSQDCFSRLQEAFEKRGAYTVADEMHRNVYLSFIEPDGSTCLAGKVRVENGAITAILFAQLLYELLRKRNQYDEERF